MQCARLASSLGALAGRRYASALPEHAKITMPKVSPTMTAGRLVVWKKREGDAIAEGDDIADVESDKATMPICARDDGYMARIFVRDDTPDISLGQLLAITVEERDHVAAFADFVPPPSADQLKQVETQPAAIQATAAPPPRRVEYDGPLGPAIMRMLNEYPRLNLDAVIPTGPKGRILKGDVLAAIESGAALSTPSAPPAPDAPRTSTKPTDAPSTPSTPSTPPTPPTATTTTDASTGRRVAYTDVPVTSMRRAIAKRLVDSKTTVPHRYASARYTLDALLALRARLNAARDGEARLSVNDFVLKAVGVALRRVPAMNMRWDEVTGAAVPNESVDVSMAVAVHGGLITPIVTRVDVRGLADVAKETKRLVRSAKEGTLAPEEFEGGCFSVSNLGMFGVSHFSAIINPPQSGILAVAAPLKRAVADEDSGDVRVVTQGMATLSSDGRVIEEETAAEFLDEFTRCMSDPEDMIL